MCYKCTPFWMRLFYGPQKIFKGDDGCVVWWVSATSKKEAVEEVLQYERAAGCDLIKDEYWKEEENLDDLAYEIGSCTAKQTIFYTDSGPDSTMWDEFVEDPSTHILGCSEW